MDVQTCFAGAPLLPSITNEIFFRMINTPSIRLADYCPKFFRIGFIPSFYANSVQGGNKKTPLGPITQGVTQATIQQSGFLHPNGTGLMVLRRHLPVTLPFAGRILPNLNYIWNLNFCQELNPKPITVCVLYCLYPAYRPRVFQDTSSTRN